MGGGGGGHDKRVLVCCTHVKIHGQYDALQPDKTCACNSAATAYIQVSHVLMLQVCGADVCINVARKVTKLKVKTSTFPLAHMQVTVHSVLVQVTMQTRKTFLGDKSKICGYLHAQDSLHHQSGAFISASNFYKTWSN